MLYKSGVSLILFFFFVFFHPAGSMRNVLTIEIFATVAITSWKSTFTISFTKGSCGTIKIKDVVFPFYFSEKESSGCFEKNKWKFIYLFRIPRRIKLLLVFPSLCWYIWCVFLFSSWKKRKNPRGILKLIKTIGGIAQMFRHFPPAGIVWLRRTTWEVWTPTYTKFIFTLLSADDVFEWWTIDMVAPSAPTAHRLAIWSRREIWIK